MNRYKKIFTGAMMVLIAALFISVSAPAMAAESATAAKKTQKKEMSYVASKEGGKFHKSTCGIVNNIKPENKITFKTKAEAEKAGYSPCGICKP